jgi:hypothetical protein
MSFFHMIIGCESRAFMNIFLRSYLSTYYLFLSQWYVLSFIGQIMTLCIFFSFSYYQRKRQRVEAKHEDRNKYINTLMAEKECSSLNSLPASNMNIDQQDKKVFHHHSFFLFIQVFQKILTLTLVYR